MTINAGIWIDHHRAVVVLLSEDREDMLQILADQASGVRTGNGSREKNSYTRNDFVAEDKRERKLMLHLREYFDKVVACVKDAHAIVIMGPGQAKGEFRSRLRSQPFRGHIAEMKTVSKLTDKQIANYVREHFQ